MEIEDVVAGCSVSVPGQLSSLKLKYIGRCVNGKAAGQGTASLLRNDGFNQFECSGIFTNGSLNGKAKCLISNGEQSYEGDMKDMQANGIGIYKYIDGSIYKGAFSGLLIV